MCRLNLNGHVVCGGYESELMFTVIGCGNPNRSDDGVGTVVARKLLEKYSDQSVSDLQIFDAGTDGMGVMFQAKGSSSLIIVDACTTGEEPGAIYAVPGTELEGKPPDSYNLHDFRWDHALYAGRQIFKDEFPGDVLVYLIQAKSLDFGLGLSSEVEKAATKVISKISTTIESRQ